MNSEILMTLQTPSFWLDTGGQEDELEEAKRQEKEAKERGEEVPDEDLEKQRRLNRH